ncbi:MAG: excinuclease ABC subunit UvrC [Marinilabiliaceae bacterium]|nr:excinuclease ABC subunit UvrC [Marinilabiliaceae bacterium]
MEKREHINNLKKQASCLPDNPGIYQFFDENDKLLYIGKAKNLKKRVSQYFNREHEEGKTRVLVSKIRNFRHITVDSEEDALLLENNLIKKHLPRYNLLLKDDKSYPWITIRNENFPRVYKTRKMLKDGSQYFGPYTSVLTVNTLTELFRKIYKLRTCATKLTQENIEKQKFKRCLQYHIKNCNAPCEGLQQEVDYQRNIDDIQNILKGNIGSVIRYLKEKMKQQAELYHFEEAEAIKQQLNLLTNFQSKSTIVCASIHDVDVISIINDENSGYVNFLKVINGAIIQAYTVEIKKKLNESDNELLSFAIVEMRERFQSNAKEIIVPFIPTIKLRGVVFTLPKRGDKKSLLELSERNVKFYRIDKLKQQSNITKLPKYARILSTLKTDLNMEKVPVHIECFDNSNIQGAFPVAACVVFKNGKPSLRDYRHFNIKTVDGPDDFASMEEIIFRRYNRLLEEEAPLPQLIVIDGGKGQLSAAINSLKKLNIDDKITIIGIAKRLEEIFFPDDPIPLYLDKSSESLKLIQQIRNEAHRFAITFHRNKRSSTFLKSQMENIYGIGDKTIEILMPKFKSVAGIKKASIAELADIVGEMKAKAIIQYFQE